MAGQIKPEDLLFHGQHFFFAKLGQVWQRDVHGRGAIFAVAIEEPALTAASIGQNRRSTLHGPIDRRHELTPACAERIECSGLDQRFNRRSATRLRIDSFAEIEQVRKRPALLSRRHDRF